MEGDGAVGNSTVAALNAPILNYKFSMTNLYSVIRASVVSPNL